AGSRAALACRSFPTRRSSDLGWRGAEGRQHGKGAANPRQLEKYVENGCFWKLELPPGQRYFKHANRDYLEWAASVGFIPEAKPVDRKSTRLNSSHVKISYAVF